MCAKNYNLLRTASRSPKNAPSLVPSTHPLNLPPLCVKPNFSRHRVKPKNFSMSDTRYPDIHDIELLPPLLLLLLLLLSAHAPTVPGFAFSTFFFFFLLPADAAFSPGEKEHRWKKVGMRAPQCFRRNDRIIDAQHPRVPRILFPSFSETVRFFPSWPRYVAGARPRDDREERKKEMETNIRVATRAQLCKIC